MDIFTDLNFYYTDMKIAFLTAGFILVSLFVTAQDKIFASSSSKGPVIEHKVSAGETLYGVARNYNAKASELAAANGFDMNRNLRIGEVIKIPLVATNFNQKDKKGTPVYYTVGEGEGLLSVSSKFNKLPLKSIRDWNGLKTDVAPKDRPLIVGYLRASTVKPTAETAKKSEPVAEAAKPVAKTTPSEAKKAEQIVEEKIVAKQQTEQTSRVEPVIDEAGFFKTAFEKLSNAALLNNRTLMSGVFKTDAGYTDKKYYMLVDGLVPGTIVKISNPQNGKVVYAKVLGNMKDVKYSEGLNMRISEAAAAVMQLNNMEQFVVTVYY